MIPYILIYVNLIKSSFSSISTKREYAPSLCFSVFIFVVFSIISHVVIYPTFLIYMLFWGYISGLMRIDKSKYNIYRQQQSSIGIKTA